MEFAFKGVKVLDFTGEIGPYAAKLFVGMGADVIHLEAIDGDPLRNIGPFFKDKPDRERSLPFLYYNLGKRGMALDIDRPEGKEIFRHVGFFAKEDIIGMLKEKNIL